MALYASGFGDAQFSPALADALTTPKMIHRYRESYTQKTGTAVVAETQHFLIAKGNGTIKSVQAVITGVVPTGADNVTVDIKKGNTGSAFASILSAVITLNVSSTLRTPQSATITSNTISAADLFQVVIAVSGSTGQGLLVMVEWDENP